MGALRALGFPLGAAAVRVLAAGELVLGGVALAEPSTVVAALVAGSYVVFAAVTAWALARGLPIDSCGCLGRIETPPSGRHLLVLGVGAVGAAVAAVAPEPGLFERIGDGGGGVVFALAAGSLAAGGAFLMRTGRA